MLKYPAFSLLSRKPFILSQIKKLLYSVDKLQLTDIWILNVKLMCSFYSLIVGLHLVFSWRKCCSIVVQRVCKMKSLKLFVKRGKR